MLLPIVAIPAAVHELSHILTLRLLGQRITGIVPDARGLCICYDGPCSAAGHILAALAGPVGGAAYAFIASSLAGAPGCEWIHHSAGMSMLLTVVMSTTALSKMAVLWELSVLFLLVSPCMMKIL